MDQREVGGERPPRIPKMAAFPDRDVPRGFQMIKVGIVGGTGYTGVELLRLLARHPRVQLQAITSRKEAGMPVADMYPSLRGHVDLAFVTPDDARLTECNVVFFATPHGVAMAQAR